MSGFAAWLVETILSWLAKFLGQKVEVVIKDKASHQGQIDQAAQDMKPIKDLKDDASVKEVDDAIDDALKHL